MSKRIAVLDIGKTNAKLSLLDTDGRSLWQAERATPVVSSTALSPLTRALDLDGISSWLVEQLAHMPDKEKVQALVPIAHGAAMVMLDAAGQALLAPDYEDPAFEALSSAYSLLRPAFSETFSPALPGGLNLGQQLYTVQTALPALFSKVQQILLYPQYWAWYFSGIAASEVTSLGCHTDLWQPEAGCFSTLAQSRKWATLFPAVMPANASLGNIRPALAQRTGLPPDCKVICGIHDSNASYLAHLLEQPQEESFSVISSGTWCVVLAKGAPPTHLAEAKDMLANVDAFGRPTPTARFMGGREYAAIIGENTLQAQACETGLQEVLAQDAMALPSFAMAGPFAGQQGQLLGCAALSAEGRLTLASLYCALVADALLSNLGSTGPVLVDGPLAVDPLFATILQTLRPDDPVIVAPPRQSARTAALWLAGCKLAASPPPSVVRPVSMSASLLAYKARWQERITAHQQQTL